LLKQPLATGSRGTGVEGSVRAACGVGIGRGGLVTSVSIVHIDMLRPRSEGSVLISRICTLIWSAVFVLRRQSLIDDACNVGLSSLQSEEHLTIAISHDVCGVFTLRWVATASSVVECSLQCLRWHVWLVKLYRKRCVNEVVCIARVESVLRFRGSYLHREPCTVILECRQRVMTCLKEL
jgi:hypothetical protein